MTPGAQIALTARIAVAGRLRLTTGGVDLTRESGWCLAFVRRIVELAFDAPEGAFYRAYGTHRVERAPGPPATAWWARDLERSMRSNGMAVPAGEAAEDGDILFNWQAAPNGHGVYVGHVGILADAQVGLVVENVHPAYRRWSLTRGAVALTPRERFPVTTTIRIREPLTR